MSTTNKETTITARVFRSRVNSYALWGTGIAVVAVVVGTLLVAWFQEGTISLDGMIAAQGSNPALWLLNIMPFVFGIWGQYTGAMMMWNASELVMDQTRELRDRASALEQELQASGGAYRVNDLPDRAGMRESLAEAIDVADQNVGSLGVLMLDFDDFHDVREVVGDESLPELIENITTRLRSALRSSDVLAHFGNDEFGMVLHDVGGGGYFVKEVCQRLQKALRAPMEINDHKLSLQARVGATVFPRDGDNADELMRRSEISKQSARVGEHEFVRYRKGMEKAVAGRMQLVADFARALEQSALEMRYIPQSSADSQACDHLRAEVSWPHDTHGRIPEQTLNEIAERGGYVYDYILWRINQGLQDLEQWRKHENADVNLVLRIPGCAVVQVALAEMLDGIVSSFDLPAESLVLEFSEKSLIAGEQKARGQIEALRKSGYRISLHGFGTEQSSPLGLLRWRPHEVRMARQLVDRAASDRDTLLVTGHLIKMAARMVDAVVAPGVNNATLIEQLARAGCKRIEGESAGKLMTADRVGYWLKMANEDKQKAVG